jgi:hypothetical protein
VIDFGHSEYWSARQETGSRTPCTPARASSSWVRHAWLPRALRAGDRRIERSGAFGPRDRGLEGARGGGSRPLEPDGALSRRRRPARLLCLLRVHHPAPTRARSTDLPLLPVGAGARPKASVAVRPHRDYIGDADSRDPQQAASSTSSPRSVPAPTASAAAPPCLHGGADEPGEPVPGPGDNLAQMTIHTSRPGAIVFNSHTLGRELGLEPVPSAHLRPRSPRTRGWSR